MTQASSSGRAGLSALFWPLICVFLAGVALWSIAQIVVPWLEYWMGRETLVFRLISPQHSQLVFLVAGVACLGLVTLIVWHPAKRVLIALSDSRSVVAQAVFALIVGIAALLWVGFFIFDKAMPRLDYGKELSKPAYLEWIARRVDGYQRCPSDDPGALRLARSAENCPDATYFADRIRW